MTLDRLSWHPHRDAVLGTVDNHHRFSVRPTYDGTALVWCLHDDRLGRIVCRGTLLDCKATACREVTIETYHRRRRATETKGGRYATV